MQLFTSGNIREVQFKLEHCNCTRKILSGDSNVHSVPDGEQTTKGINVKLICEKNHSIVIL